MRPSRSPGMLGFLVIWLGQTISLAGSAFTSFSVGIWVYESSGSVTRFTLTALCAVIPPTLLSPFVGALVDRWDRRRAMILSDAGVGLGTLALAALFWSGRAELWHLCALLTFNSVFGTFQFPAFSAAITALVPKAQLGRANGLVQLGASLATLFAPLASGFLVESIGIKGVLAIDFLTCLVAVGTLLVSRIPPQPETAARPLRASLLAEAAEGWRFIRVRPGLLALMGVGLGLNFTNTLVETLVTPLVLSFATPSVLGLVVSGAGIGMALGGITMSIWGAPRQRVPAILALLCLQSAALLVGGLRADAVLIASCAFIYLFCTPVISGTGQVIWQCKVPQGLQGRVFAIRQMVATSALPLAYIAVGPLSDHVFTPLLMAGGALAGSVGRVIGVGPGRGLGLFLIVIGVLVLSLAAAGFRSRSLTRLEEDLPDAILDGPGVLEMT